MNKHIKSLLCILCFSVATNAIAATSYKKNCKCKSKCDSSQSIIDQPLPPYIVPETPDCKPLPARPYAIPMQGLKYMWMVGADYFYMYAEPKGSFTEILRSQKVGGTLYVAQRFRNPFGYELGYSWTDRKPKTLQTVPGTVAFNNVATINAEDTGRMRLKTTYLDLQTHTRLCKFIESKFIVGVGWVRQSLEFTYSPFSTTDPVQNAMRNMEKRTAMTVRLGVGAQALMTDRIGIRFILMYENLSHMPLRNTPPGINQNPLHDSLSGSIGLFWTIMPLAEHHSVNIDS